MADPAKSKGSSEELKKELSAAYARAQALFMLLSAASAYMLLAAFDTRASSAFGQKIATLDKQLSALAQSFGDGARDCRRAFDGRADALAGWKRALEVSERGGVVLEELSAAGLASLPTLCSADCANAVRGPAALAEHCRPDAPAGTSEFALAERVQKKYEQARKRHEQRVSALQLAQSGLDQTLRRWNQNAAPAAQDALKHSFVDARQRLHRRELEERRAQAELDQAAADAAAAQGGAASFIKTQSTLHEARASVTGLLAQRETLQSERDKAGEQYDAERKQRLKLPVLDIELSRPAFNLVAPLMVCLLFAFFCAYVRNLPRPEAALGEPGARLSQADLAAFPWPLLLQSERTPPLRRLLAAVICALVPLAILAVAVSTAHDVLPGWFGATAKPEHQGFDLSVGALLGQALCVVIAIWTGWLLFRQVGGFLKANGVGELARRSRSSVAQVEEARSDDVPLVSMTRELNPNTEVRRSAGGGRNE